MHCLLWRNAVTSAVNDGRCNALHVAAEKGQLEICTLLLNIGASLHEVDEEGNTPLHYAALSNQLEITNLLLSRGAIVNALNNVRRSVLHIAALKSQRELCTLLLDAGAFLHVVDQNGFTPLHYAAYGNQPEITYLLLSRGAAINALNNVRRTALHVAAEKGQHEVCTLLLDAGASLHTADKDGNTPLHCAALANQPKIMDLLLSRGAAFNAVNNIRCSALHISASRSQRELCSLLLDVGASLDVVDLNGFTPLHYAIIGDQPEITNLLLSRGAAIDAVNYGGDSALHVAALYGHRELCSLLLDSGAFLHLVNKNGDTPLHYAAIGNQPEIMELLLSQGAAVNAVSNGDRSTLHIAVNKQHVQCVRVLLGYHCDINLQDSYGNTALHDAIGMKDALDVIDALCACETVDFTLRNKQGFNILHYAALNGNAHAMGRLVTRARHLVNVKKEDGFVALHLAAWNGHREVAAIVLSQNGCHAKVDLRNNIGQTPLHLATLKRHWPLVELLVHHNADVGSTDKDGDTVLHIAIADSLNQQTAVPTLESSRNSPLIYAIWQNLARQGAKTELALACFLVSVDKSCKVLEQVINNNDKTPLDLLEGNPQATRLAGLLRSYKYQNHRTQLEIENNPLTGYRIVELPPYRINNISLSELGLRCAKKNIVGSCNTAECRDGLGIIAENTNQENRFDPSSSVTQVNRIRCGYNEIMQMFEDRQLATGKVSTTDPENKSKDVSLDGKHKEDISDREKEKDKNLERLRYLETRVADLEEANLCSICMDHHRNIVFCCGHSACKHCAAQLKICHICRKKIRRKINLY
ncbi:PREDICTED: E3 ubiquitin-protein ligase MIB2-like isoform X2 [Wasmannia auropunctata]|uniref:E3 ubiquitin-protein ligase MIB2-like isoform X2 n=1 Tax=Wasmannia auropunctata TaxID=64793 RepID=UPI0005EFD1DF|nr:PREDICTED: E3 ubiquitin-protein ligase MIB2-like isoform X2 [Wasmannia auropunctata]